MTDAHDLRLEIKSVDDAGTFSGLASTFGPPADTFRDVIAANAFTKSLSEHKKRGTVPLMLWAHDTSQPIGRWTEVKETRRGLAVKGKLTLQVQKAKEAHALMRDGAIDALSIGFRLREFHREKGGTRVLSDIDLLEISLVTMPANSQARINGVKELSTNPSKLKDGNGQYLWQPSIASGVPPTLLGYDVVIAEDMADIGAGNEPVAFGDFRQAYTIVDRIGVRVLRDPYTSKPNVPRQQP